MSTILTCLWHFGQRVQRITMKVRTPSLSMKRHKRSPEVYRVCEAVASPYLPLTGDTLVTEGILIFQMWSLRLSLWFHMTFRGIAFQVLKTYMLLCVYEEIPCRHFCEKWLLPLYYLTFCHSKVISVSKLKKTSLYNLWHASKETNQNWTILCFGVLMLHDFLRFP